MRNRMLILLAIVLTANLALAQTTGDFRSKQNGNWGTAATWQVYNGIGWADSNIVPPAVPPYANVTISAGDTVVVEASPKRALSLNVEGTAFLYANSTTNRYVRLWGNVTNDGTVGTLTDGLCYMCSTSVAINGMGSTDIARLQVAAANVSVSISCPISLHYAGAGLYGNNVDNITYNVTGPSGQVSFGPSTYAGITTNSSFPSPYSATYNLDAGSFKFQTGMNFNISVRSGKKSVLNLYTGLTLGDTLFAYSDSAGTEVVNLYSNGGITFVGMFTDTLRFDSLNNYTSSDYNAPCPAIIMGGLGLINGGYANYSSTNLRLARNATVTREAGRFNMKPSYPDTFNLVYSGSAACTTSYELPNIEDNSLVNLTINHQLDVDTALIVNNVTANGGPIVVGQPNYFGVLGIFAKNSADGYIIGPAGRLLTIMAGNQDILYPVGTSDGYSPATLHISDVNKAGLLACRAVEGEHSQALVPQEALKRWWDFTWRPDSIATFGSYDLTLQYLSTDFNTDLTEASDELTMVGGKYDSSWTFPSVLSRDTSANNVRLSGMTDFSSFTFGKNQASLAGDTEAPTILWTSPATGDSGVVLDAPIIIAFSEPMDTASVDGTSTPDVPNTYKAWNATMDTLSLVHDPMDLNTTYTLILTAGKDLAGNDLSNIPDTIIFTTVVDTSHPYIVSTSPADGAVDVPLNEPVIIAFSEPIDPANFGGYNLPDISMSLSWNATFDTMTLTPDTLYEYNTTYTFYDTAGTDMFGNAIVGLPFSFGFTTIANQGPEITLVQSPNDTYDGTGPFIVRTVITDAAKAGIIADTLWYTDNKTDWWAIVHTSVDGDTFNYSIPGPLAAGTVIEFFFGAWDDGGAVQYDPSMYRGYQFRILDPLPPSGLAANSGNMQVSLGWAPPAEVLEYDTAPYAFWNWYAGDIFSTRFTPQHYPCKVEQTVSMWYDAGAGIDSIEVHIWPDNGNGIPDITTQLITPFKIMPDNYPNWTYIDLSPFNLVLSAGDFHVGYVCQSDNQPTPISDGGGPGIRTMVYDGSSWGNLVAMSVNYYDFNNKAAVTYSNYSKGLILKSYVPQNTAKPLPVLAGLKPTPLSSKLTAQYPELRGAMSLAKNISDYEVFRGDITGGPYTSLGTVSDTSYTDNTVINDNDYYYVVRANYSTPDTFSAWSNEASATPTGVEGKPEVNVFVLQLNPVTPNPVNNGKATFRFSLPEAAYVRLDVFNVLGQKLNTLVDGKKTAGLHNVNWNVTDRNGTKLASGVYIYQLSTMGKTLTKRMTIIK